MKRLRTFIAVTPEPETQEKIAQTIEALKEQNFPVHWEEPEKTHITLMFLGHINQSRMEEAAKAAQETAQNFAPFDARLNGLSYFFKKGADSIIFLNIQDPNRNFRNLYKELFRRLSEEGFYPPKRFSPHITIGRLKRQRHAHKKKKLLAEIAETEIPEIGSFTVEKLDVYESIFDPASNKQRYHLLKSFELLG